jgi:hypothetical protein
MVKNAYKSLVRESEGERTLGRLRCRCEYNITTDVKELRGRRQLDSHGSEMS